MRAVLLGVWMVVGFGCSGPVKDGADTDNPDVIDTDVADTDVLDTDVADTDDTSVLDTDVTDTDPAPTSCKEAGGICTGSAGGLCGRGRVLSAFASDCIFDDGPGVCCQAPAEQPTGDTCRAMGGVCAPIGGCLMVDGYLAEGSGCGGMGPTYTCCVPEAQCGPAQYDCCTDQTVFRSTCTHGVENCDHISGTVASPINSCVVP